MNHSNSHREEEANLAPESSRPDAEAIASPMDSVKHCQYHNLDSLTKAATAILITAAVWGWIRWWSVTNLLLIQGFGKLTRNFPWLPLQALMLRYFLGCDAVTLVAFVVFLTWVYGAYRNALALGSAGLTFTPGMAAGIYVVPIVNLWWPYQTMRETLLASQMPNGKPDAPKPRLALVGWWWGVFVVNGAAALILNLQLVVQRCLAVVGGGRIIAEKWLNDLSGPVLLLTSVPRLVLTIFLITRIASMQDKRAQALGVAVGSSVLDKLRQHGGHE